FHRRRIVRTGLTGNETLGGFESHHLLDSVELELVQLRLALGLVIELAGNGAFDEVQGRLLQFFRCDYSVDGTDFQRVFSPVFFTGGNPLDGVIGTDDPWQANRTAEARVKAEFDFRQADLGAA